jgi:type II secretory pathway component PulJ
MPRDRSSKVNSRAAVRGFTLAEILVSIVALTLLLVLVARLLNSASIITTLGGKRMDSDNQARSVLDRMAEDFSQIVKRTDVDYFLKNSTNNPQTGSTVSKNDQIAFYTQAGGYYATALQSHFSLVGYRLNSDPNVTTASLNKLERLGKALAWNGDVSGNIPMVFLPIPLASPLPSPLPSPMPSPYPAPAWPQAGNMAADPAGNYEVIGPQVLRFEYYYQLQSGDLNDSPWDDINPNPPHSTINGLQDVGAIVVLIATIDPKSRVLVTDNQLTNLAGQMPDYVQATTKQKTPLLPLQVQWQAAVNAAPTTSGILIPAAAAAGIRIYQRYFYLNGRTQ